MLGEQENAEREHGNAHEVEPKAQALLEADRAQEDPTRTSGALLHHLEREVQIWTEEFRSWSPKAEERTNFQRDRAFQAERNLHQTLKNLKDFLGTDTYNDYEEWFQLTGGWKPDDLGADAPANDPLPAWVRDWNAASNAASTLAGRLEEAVALQSYIRFSAKLSNSTDVQASDVGVENPMNVNRLQE